MSAIEKVEVKLNKKYKGYYSKLKEIFISNRGASGMYNWSQYCYVPINHCRSIVELKCNDTVKEIHDSCIMSAFSGWIANGKKTIKVSKELEKEFYNLDHRNFIVNKKDIFETIGYGLYVDYPFAHVVTGEKYKGILLHIDGLNDLDITLRADLFKNNKKSFENYSMCIIDDIYYSDCVVHTIDELISAMDERDFFRGDKDDIRKRACDEYNFVFAIIMGLIALQNKKRREE